MADFTRVEIVLYLDRYAYPKRGALWIPKPDAAVNGKRCIRSLPRDQKVAVYLVSWAADGLRQLLRHLRRRGEVRFVDHHRHSLRTVAEVYDVPPVMAEALRRLAKLRTAYMGKAGEERNEAWREYSRFERALIDCQSLEEVEELLGLEREVAVQGG